MAKSEDIEVTTKTPVIVNWEATLLEADREAQRLHEARLAGIPLGPVVPFPKLGESICGYWPTGTTLIHGQPGVGKTAFALQCAALCKCPSLVVSCEMSPLELLRRTAARIEQSKLHYYKNGFHSPQVCRDHYRQAARALSSMRVVDARNAYASVDWIVEAGQLIRDQARKNEEQNSEHLLIVLDSIHTWALSSDSTASEYDLLGSGIKAMNEVAAELNCAVMMVGEQNRESMKQGAGKALTAGAGHRKLEYGPELVIGLYHGGDGESDPKPDDLGEVPINATIAKNRNGEKGTIKFGFHGAFQEFTEGGRS